EVRFCCAVVGATQPTEFGAGFDAEVLGPALDSWGRHGPLQEEFMQTGDVADVLLDVLGTALAHPGVGVETLVLRSPAPVLGTDVPARGPAARAVEAAGGCPPRPRPRSVTRPRAGGGGGGTSRGPRRPPSPGPRAPRTGGRRGARRSGGSGTAAARPGPGG